MTTETNNTHPGDHAPQPLALQSNAVLGPTPPLVERLRDWADDTYELQAGELPDVRRDLAAAADEIERLRTPLTPQQLDRLIQAIVGSEPLKDGEYSAMVMFATAVERAHGIGA